MAFPSGLRALNHRDFRRFFAAQLVALVGTWMQTVAQSWLVLSLTDSPLLLGLVGTLQFGPILLFSIFAGAVADRFPKRRLLLVTQLVLAAQALALAALVASGQVRYWHVGCLATLVGLANALDMPTRQALVADMVGKADVVNAVALNSAAFNAARIVGPGIAGVLIARAGMVPAFVVNACGFLIVVAALLTVRVEGAPRRRGGGVLAEVAEGVRYAARTPAIRLVLGLLFVVSICVFNFTVYVPLLARNVLGLGADGFGFLMAALGVGAVCGALALGMQGAGLPSFRRMTVAAALALGGLMALGAARTVPVAAALLFFTGFFGITLVASCNTWLQLAAPDDLRGRMMSLYALVWGGVFPIGAFCVGAISEAWGVSTAFVVSATFGLVALAGLVLWWRGRG